MDHIPDITERPWWTAAQPYCDPNAPNMPEDTNIYIDYRDKENTDEC